MEQPNLSYIEELSGDNLELKIKLIGIIKKELPIEIKVYSEQMGDSNFIQAAQSVHKLKHKISILGLEKSYYIAEEHENNLKNSSTKLAVDFENILKSMVKFVDHL
jgi:hypothetical protein